MAAASSGGMGDLEGFAGAAEVHVDEVNDLVSRSRHLVSAALPVPCAFSSASGPPLAAPIGVSEVSTILRDLQCEFIRTTALLLFCSSNQRTVAANFQARSSTPGLGSTQHTNTNTNTQTRSKTMASQLLSLEGVFSLLK